MTRIAHTTLKSQTIISFIYANKEKIMPRPAIHPGEILGDELNEIGISAAALARALHVPTNRITAILNGQRAITADTALRLGRWLGTGPQLWLNLQTAYELRRAELESGQEIESSITPRRELVRA